MAKICWMPNSRIAVANWVDSKSTGPWRALYLRAEWRSLYRARGIPHCRTSPSSRTK